MADELFLTSSIREIAPLVRIATSAVGTGRPGTVTRRLIESYAALVRDECGA
jgi:branched-subunit amino acid aminotransferase/4-amino-4-deoxychorismate lyase